LATEEPRIFFRTEFKTEALRFSQENKDEIKGFSSKIRNNNLEEYLKELAWDKDSEGEVKVYLVRNHEGKIVLFFSLRCGIAFTTYELDSDYRELSPVEKSYVDEIVKAKKTKDTNLHYKILEQGKSTFENHNKLVQIADHRYNSKNESHEVGDVHNVMKVEQCYPAIELLHICRCDNYKLPSNINYPLGFGIFWEKIVPIILEVANKVGCVYFYLFAADRSENNDENRLISYYKDSLQFRDIENEGVIVLKPKYDDNCTGLLQTVQYLEKSREDAWQLYEEFSQMS